MRLFYLSFTHALLNERTKDRNYEENRIIKKDKRNNNKSKDLMHASLMRDSFISS